MTDFTEVVEVVDYSVPQTPTAFTMDQLEFAEWWDEQRTDPEIDGRELLQRVLSANGDWIEQGAWRLRRRIV